LRAKYSNADEFEAALKKVPLTLFSSSGGPNAGASWRMYKTGDPADEHPGDVRIVLRRGETIENIKNTITRFQPSTSLYKRISATADFKVRQKNSVRNFSSEESYITLFELEIEWNYTIGIDQI